MAEYKQSFYNIQLYGNYTNDERYKDVYYNIRSGKFAYLKGIDSDNIPNDLIQDGFFVPETVSEQESYRQAQINAITDDYPSIIALTICTTMRCNYNCAYCFEGNRDHGIDMKENVVQDTIAYIKNEIDRNKNLKKLSIVWFGGEPLLNIKAIKDISNFVIPYCKEHNVEYDAGIVTNGYLFTSDISKQLKDLEVKYAQITLDGFAKTYCKQKGTVKESFNTVITNIKQSAIDVIIKVNVTRDTQDECIELLKELSKLRKEYPHVKNMWITRIREFNKDLKYGFTDEEWLDFREKQVDLIDYIDANVLFCLDKANLMGCKNIQKRNVIICSDGYLYRCDNHIGQKAFAVGTIKEGIKNCDTEKKYVCSMIDDNCMKCKYLPICCGGKCRYNRVEYNHKACKLIKEKFKQNMQNYLTYVRPI